MVQELSSLARGLSGGELSSVELTQSYLSRIAGAGELNAYITVDEELSLQQARQSDERRARGESLSPLDGIPVAHKDIFCTRGMLTSCGSHILDGFIAPYDATVIRRFKDGGAVLLGKTNMGFFVLVDGARKTFRNS